MIGNDIVDLSVSEIGEGERRSRYLEKILTEKEMRILESLGTDDKWIWLLWSIKESVYKIVSRKEQKTRYAPKSLQCLSVICSREDVFRAKVYYQGSKFESTSIINEDYIHTIASSSIEEINQSIPEIFTIPSNENESEYTKNRILKSVQGSGKYESSIISIIKDNCKVPSLYDGVEEIGYLSISHHGRFGAFVIFEKFS